MMPCIGIFWGLTEGGQWMLLADLVPVAQGEAYGDFLTHGGHYDYWQKLSAIGASELRRRGLPTAPVWSEYEEWPRGRVVYHVPTGRFIVYADRQLRQAPWPDLVARRFSLPEGSFDLQSDLHYVSFRRV